LTLGELASRTGASSRYLREVISRRADPYDDITRPKKDGTTRPISSPEPVLMDVQRWLLKNVLRAAPAHHCSWAYQSGRSIVGCASEHIGARWLVKVDVHDFFGSIDEIRVYELFRRLQYPSSGFAVSVS
jgi:RNA-directed DNA polymerase